MLLPCGGRRGICYARTFFICDTLDIAIARAQQCMSKIVGSLLFFFPDLCIASTACLIHRGGKSPRIPSKKSRTHLIPALRKVQICTSGYPDDVVRTQKVWFREGGFTPNHFWPKSQTGKMKAYLFPCALAGVSLGAFPVALVIPEGF